MIRLSKNFALKEFFATGARHYENWPESNQEFEYVYENLQHLTTTVLQPIRDEFGSLIITSGYRSLAYNTKIGGARASQHLDGYAADFVLGSRHGCKQVYDWIVVQDLPYDQLIYEFRTKGSKEWIHVSSKVEGRNRKMYFITSV